MHSSRPTPPSDARILIVGAGAIGALTAAFMRMRGYRVTLVCKYMAVADLANGRGIRITGVQGDHLVTVPSVADPAELQDMYDLCFMATKAYDLTEAAKSVLSFLKKDALVATMQDGMAVEELAAAVGRERTVGCAIGFGATLLQPCDVEMTSGGQVLLGKLDGTVPPLLEVMRDVLSCVVPAQISARIEVELYAKLLVNACITSLGAVTGLRLGELMFLGRARRISLCILREGLQVADAMGITVPPYGGRLDFYRLVRRNGFWSRMYRLWIVQSMKGKFARMKSSALQSLERGKPTEIDYLNGYIVRKGEELGVPTPANAALVQLIRNIEQGVTAIKVKNLDCLPC